MRKPSPSMIVALVALFVALSGVGSAANGGNLILGHSNTASKNTVLSAPVAGGSALQVTNNNATNASTALGLNVAAGHAPLTVNSGVKVANLNADLLDGFDSSALQQRVSGNCSNGNAIQAIASNGAVTCQNIQTNVDLNLDAQSPPPFPTTFTTHGGPLLLTFSGSGYRESGSPGFIAYGVSIDGASVGVSQLWLNETNSDRATRTRSVYLTGWSAGTHTFKLSQLQGSFDSSVDGWDATIIELPH